MEQCVINLPCLIVLKDGTEIELKKTEEYSAIMEVNKGDEVYFWKDGEYDGCDVGCDEST